jgi:hypothetical protein
MESYSTIKKKEILSVAGKNGFNWRTSLSEVSQAQKTTGCHIFSLTWNIAPIQIQKIL